MQKVRVIEVESTRPASESENSNIKSCALDNVQPRPRYRSDGEPFIPLRSRRPKNIFSDDSQPAGGVEIEILAETDRGFRAGRDIVCGVKRSGPSSLVANTNQSRCKSFGGVALTRKLANSITFRFYTDARRS